MIINMNWFIQKNNPNLINLIDNNDHYLLFKITNIENKLPDVNSKQFRDEIIVDLKNQFKFEFNKKARRWY